MSLNVNALSVFNDELSSGLISEIFLKATAINGDLGITRMFGIKGDTTKINYTRTSMTGSNALCAFVDSGSTILNQATMSICPLSFSENICLDTLAKYWTSWFAESKYNTEQLPFEEIFFNSKTDYVAKEVDKIVFQGNKSTGVGNLALCDGFLAVANQISASTVNVTKTAMTASNGYAVVDKILESVPALILDNASLFLSPADFQAYLMSLRSLNLFNYNTGSEAVTSIHHPGSIGLMVKRTNAMAGVPSGTAIVSTTDNMIIGISDESDLKFESWFSKDQQLLKVLAKMRIGVAYVFPELVVRVA